MLKALNTSNSTLNSNLRRFRVFNRTYWSEIFPLKCPKIAAFCASICGDKWCVITKYHLACPQNSSVKSDKVWVNGGGFCVCDFVWLMWDCEFKCWNNNTQCFRRLCEDLERFDFYVYGIETNKSKTFLDNCMSKTFLKMLAKKIFPNACGKIIASAFQKTILIGLKTLHLLYSRLITWEILHKSHMLSYSSENQHITLFGVDNILTHTLALWCHITCFTPAKFT